MEIGKAALEQLLNRHGKTLRKSLGQNFLISEPVLTSICTAAGSGQNILEIGAGVGWLTALLCQNNRRVVTVEIDESLTPILEETVPYKQFTLVKSDILKTDFRALSDRFFGGASFTVVGNLPYYITSQILEKLMQNTALFSQAIIMVQAEFADRLNSPPASKEYRAMSVLANYFFDIQPVCRVPSGCFVPPPNVESRVIRLTVRQNRALPPEKEEAFVRFVKSAFAARRKKLCVTAPALGMGKSEFCACLQTLGLPPDVRGEALSYDQFAALFCCLNSEKSDV